jgi:hypothetical protein
MIEVDPSSATPEIEGALSDPVVRFQKTQTARSVTSWLNATVHPLGVEGLSDVPREATNNNRMSSLAMPDGMPGSDE